MRGNPVCAPEIRIVEIKNGKYDNEMCELPCCMHCDYHCQKR